MGVHDRCLMTWQANRKRWRKIHKGKLFQVTCSELGVPETKEHSYQAANQWWRERLAAIPKIEPMVRVETYDFDTGEPTGIMVDIPQSEIEYRKSRVAELRRGFDALLRPDQVPQENTLGYHVDQWLNRQSAKVSTKDMTAGRYDNLRRAITLFREFIGSTTPIEDINYKTVDNFYNHCHGRIIAKVQGNEGGWSTDYAKFVFETSKTFIKACWSRSLLELPRNLDEHRIKVQPKAIKPITVDDFKVMVANAKGQLRLHLLLMMNCGLCLKAG